MRLSAARIGFVRGMSLLERAATETVPDAEATLTAHLVS
ncbi:MAG: hypothetical protein N5P05_004366 (plasmid) [Chroococcopsis gigantea SAG 12.99]|nr:hypothetical protein [Chroococcopsis gigantea SAG 12.99]